MKPCVYLWNCFGTVLFFSTFASRFGGEGWLKRWHGDKEGRIYFKINVADEEKIATFAARFGRTGS
jgi:hypothetical protein